MTSALEENKPLDITEWLTLNTAASPTKLPIGQSPSMNNVWTDEKPGSVVTAPGYRKVGSTPSGNPSTFCINYFKSSSGVQTFVVSDNSTVWTTVDFQSFTPIITGLSSSFQLRGMVIRDKLWLTNGSDAVRVYDGSSVAVLDGTGGTPNVPRGRYISYHDERVWLFHVPSNRSQLWFSSLTDSSGTIVAPDNSAAWGISSNNLQISEGDADFGTGLLVYRSYLYAFKQYSIWRIIGYDEYTYSRLRCRASTGTRFNESIQVVDSLVHMIGLDGIYVFDGEEADRISDVIDPSSASQSSFGFNTLQQPNSNNQFWEVSDATDWNAGAVIPSNASISDQGLRFSPCDTTKADFDAGVLKTNIDTAEEDGILKLSRQASSGSSERIGQGAGASMVCTNRSVVYGNPSYLTDGNSGSLAGMGCFDFSFMRWTVDLTSDGSTHKNIGRVIVRAIQGDRVAAASIQVNVGSYQAQGASNGTWITVYSFNIADNGAWVGKDIVADFSSLNAIQVSIFLTPNPGSYQCGEIEAYAPRYQTSGKFISKPVDYANAPDSFGEFNADIDLNGQTATFFTQSSSDGSTWDSESPCTNGGAVGSAIKRYLRWGVYFSSDGMFSPKISAAYLLSKYESAVHNTGGTIFSWGPFDASDTNFAAHSVKFFYRGASTSGGVLSASWNAIVSGGVLSIATSNVYVQFKAEIYGGTASGLPAIPGVTINWAKGTGVEAQTLQNVASFFWRNRYWMSAASKGSTSNDTILIRGKKTFKSPWQLKDWPILSFCRFQDGFYGGSSVDGSIYQLDIGYSKDGQAMDSFFETGDFTFNGNHIHCHEVEIEVERKGSYDLKFGVSIDCGKTWKEYDIDLTESDTISRYWKKMNVDCGTTPYIRFRVRTNGVDQPFEVHNIRAYYEIRQARGSIH